MNFNLPDEDHIKMLKASSHVGSKNKNFQMNQYVFDRNANGDHIIRTDMMWEKILLAARAMCAIENPKDIYAIGARQSTQRAVLKFARYTGSSAIAGRFTPGTFTNQIQKAFREPRLLIVSDPYADHQSIFESRYVNIPVIAFCNTDSDLKYVDIAIPCNNKSDQSIGLIWYNLAREYLRLKGVISRQMEWDVKVDLFIIRRVEEEEEKAVEDEVNVVPENPNIMGELGDNFGPIQRPANPVEDWQQDSTWN